ncbi:MAG: polyprenyl synthetase family protein [Planctomycetes bacterium]|nr:polyprenyl synthetase family protein [Planctomycetota bacterium]
MARILPPCPDSVSVIDEAMRYSLFAGGKRLRPGLLLAVGEALGGELDNLLPAACAIEMIHSYSLIHDDLPCMDDDDLRRGIPTCHVKFGEGMATLAGDALSNAAFQVIAQETRDQDLVAPLVLELSTAAGTGGMIGGQVLDILSEGAAPDIEVVREIHRMKTGALFVASMRLGAIAARADADQLARITDFGRKIGLAFQIMDDILDLVADAETLGKTAGKDAEQGKMTYPAAIGIEASRREARGLIEEARLLLDGLDPQGDLDALAGFIYARLN